MVSPKIRDKTGCLISPLLFNMVLEILARILRQENEIKDIHLEMNKAISICRCYDLVCRTTTELTIKLLKLTNEFIKFAGYKVNIQKLPHSYTTAKNKLKNEIKKKVLFTTATKKLTKVKNV